MPATRKGRFLSYLMEPVLEAGVTYISGTIVSNYDIERKCTMKNKLTQIALQTTKINRQHIQLAFAVLALAMLVLGIGAPSDGGANPH